MPVHEALTEVDGGGKDDGVEEGPDVDAGVELGVDAVCTMVRPSCRFREDEEEVMMKRACGMRLGKMVDEVERKRLMRAAG